MNVDIAFYPVFLFQLCYRIIGFIDAVHNVSVAREVVLDELCLVEEPFRLQLTDLCHSHDIDAVFSAESDSDFALLSKGNARVRILNVFDGTQNDSLDDFDDLDLDF